MRKFTKVMSVALPAALPVMLGYVTIGIPCGILESSVGFTPLMALFMSLTFYSGAGQFMEANMWLAGSSLPSIIASVSLVGTRQMLYSAAFAPFADGVSKRLSVAFAATVTDESFGVNMDRFAKGGWSVGEGLAVNICCMLSWGLACCLGAFIGDILDLPTALASFAMTAIFVCLLATQPVTPTNLVVAVVSAAGVFVAKLLGLSGVAVLVGAVAGVVAGIAFSTATGKRKEGAA